MAFKYNQLPYIVDQIRMYKKKAVLSNAALVAEINTFADCGWGENFIAGILKGTIRMTDQHSDIFTQFLTLKHYNYNCEA